MYENIVNPPPPQLKCLGRPKSVKDSYVYMCMHAHTHTYVKPVNHIGFQYRFFTEFTCCFSITQSKSGIHLKEEKR